MAALQLLWVFFRQAALNELQYRSNFYVAIFRSLVGLGAGLGSLAVVFAHTQQLGGWRLDELVALLGVYTLVGGAINTLVRPSMNKLMEDVRQGTLDFALTKPADSQVLISVREVQIWKLVDVAVGVALLAYALARIGASVGIAQALAFGVALLSGGAIVYSFWLFLATLSFWLVRVENILVIFQSMWEAGRWPVTIYPGWLRVTLTFVVPVAFATTVPAQAISGRLDATALAGAVALAAALLVATRLFWRIGVRRYSGASA